MECSILKPKEAPQTATKETQIASAPVQQPPQPEVKEAKQPPKETGPSL